MSDTPAPPCPICGRIGFWIMPDRRYEPPSGHVMRVMPWPRDETSAWFRPPGVRYDLCPRLNG